MKAKVTVVIPVYRVKDYLAACLDSVLSQTWKNLEVILIDDGNTDGSELICDEYAARYENVTVIHKANEGQGIARNIGMEKATGDYICFVDSDDRLDTPDAIEALLETAEKTGADITAGAFRRFDEENVTGVNSSHLIGLSPEKKKFRFRGFYQFGHLAYVWGKLYRKSFLDRYDLKEPNYRFTQDKVHNLYCFARRPKYAFLERSVYCYRVNPDSVTYRYKKDMIPVWTSIGEDIAAYFDACGRGKELSDIVSLHLFFGAFFLVKQEGEKSGGDRKRCTAALKEYMKSPLAKRSMKRLAFGTDTFGIGSLTWGFFLRVAAFFCCVRWHGLFCRIVLALREANIDRRITQSRYK